MSYATMFVAFQDCEGDSDYWSTLIWDHFLMHQNDLSIGDNGTCDTILGQSEHISFKITNAISQENLLISSTCSWW